MTHRSPATGRVEPVDPRRVAADDLTVERIRRRHPVADPLARRLAHWRDEVETLPTPLAAS